MEQHLVTTGEDKLLTRNSRHLLRTQESRGFCFRCHARCLCLVPLETATTFTTWGASGTCSSCCSPFPDLASSLVSRSLSPSTSQQEDPGGRAGSAALALQGA